MSNKPLGHKIVTVIYRYFLFFLLVAFLVTCSTLLFVTVLSRTLDIEFTDADIQTAAKLTFVNVLLLSALCAFLDDIRRKVTTERITKPISRAAKDIVKGDFDVRIAPATEFAADENFNEIIECFNTMAAELSGVDTLRTDFIANVSHEMKTPLSVIQNYSTLLQAPDLDEEKRKEYAKAISDASRRLSDMMTNILKLNRLENQQIYANTEEYDLSEQLCQSLLQYESIWESKNIEIDVDIAEGIVICQDAELLSLVWNNLFSNAFKFTPDNGKVSVSLSADDSYATVRVRDTGCGMSAEVGAHIFEKFYQGDTSRATQGNGLGLALVKRVMDITGSEISVESEVGVGTTFAVKIGRNGNGF